MNKLSIKEYNKIINEYFENIYTTSRFGNYCVSKMNGYGIYVHDEELTNGDGEEVYDLMEKYVNWSKGEER